MFSASFTTKRSKTLLLTALLCLLTACGGSTRSAELRLDPSLTMPCDQAAALPEGRGITQREAETAWLRDRIALQDCRERHALLAAAIGKGPKK